MNVADATSLVALLQQEVPRAVFEAAPTVDLADASDSGVSNT